MRQNNYSFDSLNDRNLQSPSQPSHFEYLQSKKDIIMMRITSQQYKEARPDINESPTKQNFQTQMADNSMISKQSPAKEVKNEAQAFQHKGVDQKKLQNVIIKSRNEANKAYSILNFQNILREIGLMQNVHQQLDERDQNNEIYLSEQLWRIIQFSCNSPYASSKIIISVLQIVLNRQLPVEQIQLLVQNELINNFRLCTQQKAEEFLKQLSNNNLSIQDIITSYYHHLQEIELNESILLSNQSPLKAQDTFNIYKDIKEDRHEKLYQHAQLLNQKRNTFSLLKQKEELDQCTFQPLVNRNQINNISSPKYSRMIQQDVHSRLYENAQDIKKNQEQSQFIKEKQIEEEIMQYPFHPRINKIDATEMHNTEKKNINEHIPGARTQVERMERARRIKTEKDEFWDKQMQQYREKEVKVNPTKTQQFSFMNRNPLKKEAIMYLDVNITASKKGRIALYKGDDYKKVAKDFQKIYRLNSEALKELEERVQQAIHIYYSQFV